MRREAHQLQKMDMGEYAYEAHALLQLGTLHLPAENPKETKKIYIYKLDLIYLYKKFFFI